MKILIDADGCPVVDITVNEAKKYGLACFILCDTAHEFDKAGAKTLIFSKGSDSVDFGLVNMAEKGDVVVTGDYGLAAMCLSKEAVVLRPDGAVYDGKNIESLLLTRHIFKKVKRGGGRLKGPKKRSAADDDAFKATLQRILEGCKGK